jgi:GST-like protein
MLELYHWEPTLNSAEPLILLMEKGIDFTSRYVDLARLEQHAPSFLALNSRGQVPVLVHEGRVVTETSLMLLYIEAALGGPSLTPPTPAGYYKMHMWSKYLDEYFSPAITQLGWRERGAAALLAADTDQIHAGLDRLPPDRQAIWRAALQRGAADGEGDHARDGLMTRVERLEGALGKDPYLAGPDYSIADIIMFPAARALAALLPDLVSPGGTPALVDWLGRVGERPAVRRALATARTDRPELQFAPGPEMPRWG